ncbi:response regulator [Hyphomicrobium sp. CS1GBMeth3]|uniref:response regulator n=1 Tax=Hyphomicrobium sp. CS1GBMeth3 TaxID=1892845 RepID=UPI000931405B|nr:response regulator [Hyphomicrobium sp. CS1GBMeth3]
MKRFLVADQSEIIRKVVRHYMEQLSFEVVEADCADEALELCRNNNIDALFLDWRLPGKTPVEFLTALRFSGENTRRPLIIYATTENDPADISRAFSAGADTYMMKPFDRTAFMETLSNAGLAA